MKVAKYIKLNKNNRICARTCLENKQIVVSLRIALE